MNVKQWIFDFSTILVAVMVAEIIILVLQEIKGIPVPAAESPLGAAYETDHRETEAF